MVLLIWILIAYGMSNIIVYGSIFDGARAFLAASGSDETIPFWAFFKFFSKVTSCVMCCSTWVGFFLSLVFYSPVGEFFGISHWFSFFLDGMLASGSVWMINSIVEFFEENRINNN